METGLKLCITIISILIFVCMLAIFALIAKNKMHIKQLHLINEKYKTLFANINGGMVVATYADSIDKTIVTFVSDVFTKMTGYTIEDIINLYQGRYLYVIVEEDRDEIFKQH
ncbi:MAG: PAS domain-containing protein, partial [Clostridia bacterium]